MQFVDSKNIELHINFLCLYYRTDFSVEIGEPYVEYTKFYNQKSLDVRIRYAWIIDADADDWRSKNFPNGLQYLLYKVDDEGNIQ